MIIEKASIVFGWCTAGESHCIDDMVSGLFPRPRDAVPDPRSVSRSHGRPSTPWRQLHAGMAFYKVCIILFNLVPMIALRIALQA